MTATRKASWTDELLLVSSRQLAEIKDLDPRLHLGAILKGLPVDDAAFSERLGAFSVHPNVEFIDERFVVDAHRRGLRVFAFTANDPEQIVQMRQVGVHGLVTD